MDLETTKSSSQSDKSDEQKRLDEAIAKIRAKNLTQPKTIQLHKLPSEPTKFRLNDGIKKKLTNPTPKKSSSVPSIIDRRKKQSKQKKKPKTALLLDLMKINEDAIRPLNTPIPTTPTNNQVNIQ